MHKVKRILLKSATRGPLPQLGSIDHAPVHGIRIAVERRAGCFDRTGEPGLPAPRPGSPGCELRHEIAGGLAGQDARTSLDFEAARSMLRRIDELVEAGRDFVVETTLANLTYAQKIPDWRKRGYLVSLVYLRLETVEDSIARVLKRVAAGGHSIPEDTIRRRFGRSRNYFEIIYQPIVDEWYTWASQEGSFALVDSWDGRHETRT